MLENWCWVPSQLKGLSKHYSSISPDYLKEWQGKAAGKAIPSGKIPDDVVESLVKSKNVNGSLYQLDLLHRCYFDMKIHEPTSLQEIKDMDISAEWNELQTEIAGLDGPEGDDWGHGHANFQHLMASYDAGFYGYL